MRRAPTPALRGRARGVADAQSRCGDRAGLTCCPPLLGCRAAAPPPLGAGPSLRRTGTSLTEQRGRSDVPAPFPGRHGGREGKAGSGAGGGAPPAPAPGPSSQGSPRITRCQNLNRPSTAAPRAASPSPPFPQTRPVTREGARHRALRSAAVLPGLYRDETLATATPGRTGDGDDTTTDGAAGAPLPRCPGARPRRCGPRADPRHRHPPVPSAACAEAPRQQPGAPAAPTAAPSLASPPSLPFSALTF